SANAEKLLTESDGLTNAKMQGEIRNLVGQMTALSNGISLLNETATQSTSVAAALNSGVNGENNTPQINGIAISQSKDPKASIEKQVAAIAKESEMTPKINQLSAGI
ncbi:hypothetical protein, partial [Latilactobacillus sakei]